MTPSARRPDKKNPKRTCKMVDFTVPADHRVELKESEKKDNYLDLARELKKKTVENESDDDIDCNWCSWYIHQRIGKRTEKFSNKRTSGDHPNYSIIEIGQNTEKSPRDFGRLAVTKISVKDHQLTLMWKSLKE